MSDNLGTIATLNSRAEYAELKLASALRRVSELENELFSVVTVAYENGLTEWTQVNYPDFYAILSSVDLKKG